VCTQKRHSQRTRARVATVSLYLVVTTAFWPVGNRFENQARMASTILWFVAPNESRHVHDSVIGAIPQQSNSELHVANWPLSIQGQLNFAGQRTQPCWSFPFHIQLSIILHLLFGCWSISGSPKMGSIVSGWAGSLTFFLAIWDDVTVQPARNLRCFLDLVQGWLANVRGLFLIHRDLSLLWFASFRVGVGWFQEIGDRAHQGTRPPFYTSIQMKSLDREQ